MTQENKLGYIYKISSKNYDKFYVGSTFQPIITRLKHHLSDFKAYLLNKEYRQNFCSSYDVLINRDFTIELLKEIEVSNKIELFLLESSYIIKHKNNIVNQLYYQLDKNKELETIYLNGIRYIKILEDGPYTAELKEERLKDIDQHNKYQRICFNMRNKMNCEKKTNIIKVIEEYLNLNNRSYKEPIMCICGKLYSKDHELRHKRTQQHINFIENGIPYKKEILNENILCNCGKTIITKNYNRHLLSKQHIELIKNGNSYKAYDKNEYNKTRYKTRNPTVCLFATK